MKYFDKQKTKHIQICMYIVQDFIYTDIHISCWHDWWCQMVELKNIYSVYIDWMIAIIIYEYNKKNDCRFR